MKGSWRTTMAGVLAALGVILAALVALLNGETDKIPMSEVMLALSVLATAFGLVKAKDDK